jgi:hypothetical protein
VNTLFHHKLQKSWTKDENPQCLVNQHNHQTNQKKDLRKKKNNPQNKKRKKNERDDSKLQAKIVCIFTSMVAFLYSIFSEHLIGENDNKPVAITHIE